jgi:presenilin 1
MLSVGLLLGFVSFLLLLNIIQVFNIPANSISLYFILYNFAVGGILVIFWNGPLWLQQAYLVLMSSLMAFSLSGMQEWTTWALLALLAIWDLIAVLCPYGPLKILVESSQQQNREVPALLYSVTMLYFMAKDETFEMRGREHEALEASNGTIPVKDVASNIPESRAGTPANVIEEEEEEERGLKLGLGDFVFYSVLITRASNSNWISTIICILAVITGLNLTVFLLAIYRQALPALPISIALGLGFQFISIYCHAPYFETISDLQIFL